MPGAALPTLGLLPLAAGLTGLAAVSNDCRAVISEISILSPRSPRLCHALELSGEKMLGEAPTPADQIGVSRPLMTYSAKDSGRSAGQ